MFSSIDMIVCICFHNNNNNNMPPQWRQEIQHETTRESSDEDDVMSNADEESESEPPDLITAPDPFTDSSESNGSSLERLNGPLLRVIVSLVDTMTRKSESDRVLASRRVSK